MFPSLTISPASWLANRVRAHYSALGRSSLTQLKLQKLCFYAAGVAWGHGAGAEFSGLAFEAWRHGPVLREIYYPAGAVPTAQDVEPFSAETEGHVADAVAVYGLISPWGLREQSHLEQPWIDANRSTGLVVQASSATSKLPPTSEPSSPMAPFACQNTWWIAASSPSMGSGLHPFFRPFTRSPTTSGRGSSRRRVHEGV